MTNPLVSICLPNLNTRPFLEERMETILSQTVKDWELIICDSYSQDGAWEFFQGFKGDPRVSMFQAPRAGTPGSWNYCLERARGEFIYVATSDDTAEPKCLELLVDALRRNPDCKMATCAFTYIDEAGKPLDLAKYADVGVRYSGAEIYGDWLWKNHRRHGQSEFVATCVDSHVWVTITAVLFRTSLLQDIGYFPRDKTAMGDLEWALRACLATDTIHVGQSLATLRVHKKQATQGVDFAKFGHLHVTMIEQVLKDYAALLPPALRDTKAQQQLTWPKRVQAFNGLQLYSNTLAHSPWLFTKQFGLAMTRSPGLALHQLLHGFSWRSRPRVDTKHYVEQLLNEWGLPPICQPVDAVSPEGAR